MMESYELERARERVRFDVNPDGTVAGDDGFGGQLAQTLRYACRMGNQIGVLLGLGDLQRFGTVSDVAVMARVSGDAPDLFIRAEVDSQGTVRPHMVAVSMANAQAAIDRALRRVTIDLTSDWGAIITDEGRLVGAMHDESAGHGAPASVREVGIRVLAILGALDESLRETAVRLDFVRGSLLIAALGEHAVYAQADKFDVGEVVRTVAVVQGLLAGVNLAREQPVTGSHRF